MVIHLHKALILKRNEPRHVEFGWEFPEGKKELGETLIRAVIRECEEETGLAVEIMDMVDYFEFGTASHEQVRDFTQINFLCRCLVEEPQVLLSAAHTEYRWIGEAEIPAYISNPKRAASLCRAFACFRGDRAAVSEN